MRSKPPPDALHELYKELDRETFSRQGADHLRGRADVRARRVGHWLWIIVGTLIAGTVLVGGGFCAWLLHTAKTSGQSFSAVREQVLRSYAEDEADKVDEAAKKVEADPAAP